MDKEALLNLLTLSLDTVLPADQKSALENALRNQPWLREEQRRLKEFRARLRSMEAPFNEAFADAVMDRLEKEEEGTRAKGIVRLFPKVAAACAIFLLGFALNIYVSNGNLTFDSIIGLEDLSPDEAYSLLSEVND